MIDAAQVQGMPTPPEEGKDQQDVGKFVVAKLAQWGMPWTARDHEKRIDFGEKKYDQRLRTNNGRNALLDCYQECLDAISYSAQHCLEGGGDDLMKAFATLAEEIGTKLDERSDDGSRRA
jgi:hypothetical protein